MATYEELVTTEQSIREILRKGAEARLRSIPGVVHVSVGLKERAGRATSQHSIRVYVREKLPEVEVPTAERIPTVIEGVPTDVNVPRKIGFAADTTRHRPVLGGIQVGNKIIALNAAGTGTQMNRGTFGCTATRTSDRSVVLLSNWHVLMANGARNLDPIYQPLPTSLPALDPASLPLRPSDDTDVIAKIVDSSITAKVDAAIARIDVSPCCRCCGVDYRDEINGLSVGGHPLSNNILGQRAAVSGAAVYKVGMASGRTAGRVVDTSSGDLEGTHEGVAHTLNGQIVIESAPGSADRFSVRGDSGAVVIDDDGYIVGLLFGSLRDAPPAHRTYANHIADVCAAMGITINVTTGSQPTAGVRVANSEGFVADVPELYAAARARLAAKPAGPWLWAIAEKHREEVVSLVTRRRPVSVAWHRARGPAFLAETLQTLRTDGDALPRPKDGVTLEAALARLGDALSAHGSASLREALNAYREPLLAAVRGSSTLNDVLEKLRSVGLVVSQKTIPTAQNSDSHV